MIRSVIHTCAPLPVYSFPNTVLKWRSAKRAKEAKEENGFPRPYKMLNMAHLLMCHFCLSGESRCFMEKMFRGSLRCTTWQPFSQTCHHYCEGRKRFSAPALFTIHAFPSKVAGYTIFTIGIAGVTAVEFGPDTSRRERFDTHIRGTLSCFRRRTAEDQP